MLRPRPPPRNVLRQSRHSFTLTGSRESARRRRILMGLGGRGGRSSALRRRGGRELREGRPFCRMWCSRGCRSSAKRIKRGCAPSHPRGPRNRSARSPIRPWLPRIQRGSFPASFLCFPRRGSVPQAPVLLRLLEKMNLEAPSFYPQVLMVDGNGVLHPRGFGLACHLGVMANLPTIGIGKNLYHVDGLTLSRVRKLLEDPENSSKDVVPLVGDTGRIWGAAMRSNPGSSKPIFISVGHRLSLDSCIRLVKMCCKYRVPEPIRQADIRSRRHLQNSSLDDEQRGIVCP